MDGDKKYERNILVTGGAGFIGSHVVRLLVNKYPRYRVVNLDKLTYAGNLENLRDVENAPNYVFVKADICDTGALDEVFSVYGIDGVIHLAAESHVNRSIGRAFRRPSLLSYFHGRGVWLSGTGSRFFHRRDQIRPAQSVFGIEGIVGSFRARVPRYIRFAGSHIQLFEQLRT